LYLAPLAVAGLAAGMLPQTVSASELSYTFMDFQAVDNTVDLTGRQSPVPGQTVDIAVTNGDGIAVAGSVAAGEHFFFGGSFSTSIIEVQGVVTSPLATVRVENEFDLVFSTLELGYQREIADNLDFVAELIYETANYDFGSLAGENFDLDDAGVGALLGFRWNPVPIFELSASARQSPVGTPSLTRRELTEDTLVAVGMRWYFFEDLALGFDYEAGEIETFAITLRFGFGNLPW
jgi:hypothetical protein